MTPMTQLGLTPNDTMTAPMTATIEILSPLRRGSPRTIAPDPINAGDPLEFRSDPRDDPTPAMTRPPR